MFDKPFVPSPLLQALLMADMQAAERTRIERITAFAVHEQTHPPETWGERDHTLESESQRLVEWRYAVARRMNAEYERMVGESEGK